jgi:hypothetical protein
MKFKLNDLVRHRCDHSFFGNIVGFFSVSDTPEGYVFEKADDSDGDLARPIYLVRAEHLEHIKDDKPDLTTTSLCDVLTSPELNPPGQPRRWFRPIEWRGSGSAYTCTNYFLRVLEQHPGERHGIAMDLENLAGEWEVVDPSIVRQERETA